MPFYLLLFIHLSESFVPGAVGGSEARAVKRGEAHSSRCPHTSLGGSPRHTQE